MKKNNKKCICLFRQLSSQLAQTHFGSLAVEADSINIYTFFLVVYNTCVVPEEVARIKTSGF